MVWDRFSGLTFGCWEVLCVLDGWKGLFCEAG